MLFAVDPRNLRLSLSATCVLFVWLLSTTPALAQSPQLIGQYRDWGAYAFTEGSSRVCYMISVPKAKAPANVRRGDTYLIITHRSSNTVRDEVSVTAGYAYRPDSTVNAQIGPRTFELFTKDNTAWLYNDGEERQMVQAMKGGSDLIIKGTSSRGTLTTDRYSLIGFTAAYTAISKACGL